MTGGVNNNSHTDNVNRQQTVNNHRQINHEYKNGRYNPAAVNKKQDRTLYHKQTTIKKNATRRDFSRLMIAPEVYIMKNYFQLLGCAGDDTIKDYWTGVKNNLICISMKDLDIVWPKYEERYRMHHYYGNYFEDDSRDELKTENFDFENWINLYSGILQYRPEYEKYADVIFK